MPHEDGGKKEHNQQDYHNLMEGKKVIFVEDSNDKVNADGVCGHLEAVAI